MKRNLLWLLAGVLATGLIAAGCGDDDDDGGDGGEALSKEEYLAQGNQICEEGQAELRQAEDTINDPAAPEAFITDTLVPNVQGQIDQLREGIPEGDEDTVNGILDDAEVILDDIEADPASLQGNADPFADVNPRLNEYGLTTCAEG